MFSSISVLNGMIQQSMVAEISASFQLGASVEKFIPYWYHGKLTLSLILEPQNLSPLDFQSFTQTTLCDCLTAGECIGQRSAGL